MGIYLISLYILLILLRPQEWVEALLGLPLVNITAVTTALFVMPQLVRRIKSIFQAPEISLSIVLLLGVSLSWTYPVFWLGGMQNAFLDFGKNIVLYLFVLILCQNARHQQLLLWVFILCVLFLALNGILQIHTGTGFNGAPPITRFLFDNPNNPSFLQIIAFGIFEDPNDLCMVFIFIIPVLIAELIWQPKILFRLFSLVGIPLSCYAAYLTNSRGGIVGVLGMLLTYSITQVKGLRRYLLASVGFAAVVLALPSRVSSQKGSVDLGRADAWGTGLSSFLQYPVFGIGYGNIQQVTGNIVAHNSYIHVLTELGLVGYIPWLLLIYITMVHLWRAIRNTKNLNPLVHGRLVALFSGFAGFLTSMYFLSRSYIVVLYLIEALSLTQVFIACREDRELQRKVFINFKRDVLIGFTFVLTSIFALWFFVMVANRLAGR